MYFCSGQIFHDNLVAHEKEISQVNNIKDFNPYTCWNYYSNPDHWPDLIRNTWIRPEDINNYSDLFPVVKIASRMSSRPAETIRAYAEGGYDGNLLEPGHGRLLYPKFIDNKKFPEDWFARTSSCDMDCGRCGYCGEVFKKVLTSIDAQAGCLCK
jgi:collagenase-like PrtC family protease